MSRMERFEWTRRFARRSRPSRRKRSETLSRYRRLAAEPLEDRRMLAITVDTLVDELDGSIVDGDVSLRDAIATSAPGETIDFSVTGTLTLTLGELLINKGLTIAGPGADQLAIDASGNDPTPEVDNGDGSRVFNINDGDDETNIDMEIRGLTLTGGDVTGYGGMVLSQENLTISSSAITANHATGGGGGIFVYGGVILTDSTVSGNIASGVTNMIEHFTSGGGIFAFEEVTLVRSTVSGNLTTGDQTYGGGISAHQAVTLTDSSVSGNSTAGNFSSGGGISAPIVTLTGSTVTGNRTVGFNSRGGGVYARGAVTLTGSTVSGNRTEGNDAHGGGVYARSGDIMLISSTIRGNSTAGDEARGGGVFTFSGAVTLTGSTVSANITTGDFASGGGVYGGGDMALNASTISGNSTAGMDANGGGLFGRSAITLKSSTVTGNSTAGKDADGGGVYVRRGRFTGADVNITTITHSTITDNHATYANATGGGIWAFDDPVTITGSIVAGNTAAGGNADVTPGTGTLTAGYSLIGDGTFAPVPITSGTAPFSGSFQPEGSLSALDGMPIQGTWTLEITDDNPVRDSGVLFSWSLLIDTDTNEIEYASSDVPVLINSGPHLSTITITDSETIDDLDVRLNIDHTSDDDLDVFLIAPDGTRVELFTDVGSFFRNFRDTVLNDDATEITDKGGNVIGTALSPIDPLLGPLADNGGLTRTHALLPGSPAIDAGNNALAATAGLALDQRGLLRAADGDANSSIIVDMGAFELSATEVPVSLLVVDTATDEFDWDFSPSDLSLREAIGLAGNIIGPDTITFDTLGVFATAQTIALTLGEMKLTEEVTISGPGENDLTIDAQQNSRIFNITATFGDFTIAGLTLTGGRTTGDNASSSDSAYSGGAIRSVTTGNLTIDESTIIGNSTAGDRASGGGVFSSGDVTLTGSTISGNSTAGLSAEGGGVGARGDVTLALSTVSSNSTEGSGAFGGGVYAYGNATLIDSTVRGNSTAGEGTTGGGVFASGDIMLRTSIVSDNSTTGSGARGGGMWAGNDITIVGSTVSGNSTAGDRANGGGVYARGDATLTDSTVSGNSTTGRGARGGGVFAGRNVTLTNSNVSDNSTVGYRAVGGGVCAYDAVTLTGSTVSGNSTTGFKANGGGVYNFGDVTLTASTVSGNNTVGTRAYGGGVWVRGGVMLNNSSVTDNHANSASAAGGGIFKSDFIGDDPIMIIGSIIAGNIAGGGNPDLRPGTDTLTVRYSLIGDTSGLTAQQLGDINSGLGNILDVDPLLGPLADNGGPTKTHALLPGSPAIDAGDPAIVFDPDEFDQRGEPFARVVDGGGGVARIDMGAYEDNASRLPPAVIAVVRNGGGQNFDKLVTLAFTFTEDVSVSLDELDLVLENTSTQVPVDLTLAPVTWDGGTNTATWDLSSATIEAGFHTATLVAAGITDADANALDGDANGSGGDDFLATTSLPFLGVPTPLLVALPGDTDLDGDIDSRDIQLLLAANSFNNPPGPPPPIGPWTWMEGDFDEDGYVNSTDIQLILATNQFGKPAYAATNEPAADATFETIEFSAPGVSVALVGDMMPRHNLRAVPIDVPAPAVSKSRGSKVLVKVDVMLKHNLPEPVRRWALPRRAAVVDRVLEGLGGGRMDDLVHESVTDERHPLERIWDEALLASLDGSTNA